MALLTFADLPKSPERLIMEAYAAVVRADPLVSDIFRPITVVEDPGRDAAKVWGARALVIQPWQLGKEDWPSSRETLRIGIATSAFLPMEESSEPNSKFVGLDLGNHFRKLTYANQTLINPTPSPVRMTFATVDFRTLVALIVEGKGIRILTYRAVYETDIDPRTGEFA